MVIKGQTCILRLNEMAMELQTMNIVRISEGAIEYERYALPRYTKSNNYVKVFIIM